jgi:DNA mismatch repair ATPase MutS
LLQADSAQEWTALGDKIDKALAELNVAQARALRRLRAMVVEHADAIQANAELVDEIDLTASFAQAAVELNLTRPVLHEG